MSKKYQLMIAVIEDGVRFEEVIVSQDVGHLSSYVAGSDDPELTLKEQIAAIVRGLKGFSSKEVADLYRNR